MMREANCKSPYQNTMPDREIVVDLQVDFALSVNFTARANFNFGGIVPEDGVQIVDELIVIDMREAELHVDFMPRIAGVEESLTSWPAPCFAST